jgi:hypothetical protein
MKVLFLPALALSMLTLTGCGALDIDGNTQSLQNGYYIPVTPFVLKLNGYDGQKFRNLTRPLPVRYSFDQYRSLNGDGNLAYSGAGGVFGAQQLIRTIDTITCVPIGIGDIAEKDLGTAPSDSTETSRGPLRVTVLYGIGARGTYVYHKGTLNLVYLVGGTNLSLEQSKTQVVTMGMTGAPAASFTGINSLDPAQFKESSSRLLSVMDSAIQVAGKGDDQYLNPCALGFVVYGKIPDDWKDDSKLVGKIMEKLLLLRLAEADKTGMPSPSDTKAGAPTPVAAPVPAPATAPGGGSPPAVKSDEKKNGN